MLAGIGIPLNHPIRMEGGREATLRAVLDDTTANFTLRGQIYWKVVALALYLPPQKSWKNRFGERFTFDDAARELLAASRFALALFGNPDGPITLTVLLRADEQQPVLSESVREQVREYLGRIAKTLVEIQSPEGWFPADWACVLDGGVGTCAAALFHPRAGSDTTRTWLGRRCRMRRRSREVFQRAAVWSLETLAGKTADPQWVDEWYCPASHTARSVIRLSRRQEGEVVSQDGGSRRERRTVLTVRVRDSPSR